MTQWSNENSITDVQESLLQIHFIFLELEDFVSGIKSVRLSKKGTSSSQNLAGLQGEVRIWVWHSRKIIITVARSLARFFVRMLQMERT